MKFTCDQCGTRYSISDEKVKGKVLKIRCKVCEFTMVVRGNDGSSPESRRQRSAMAPMMAPVYETEWYAAPVANRSVNSIERIRAMIRTGAITPETVVWNETLSDWTAAEQVEQLASLFAPKPKAPPPLPPRFLQSIRRHQKTLLEMVHTVIVGANLAQIRCKVRLDDSLCRNPHCLQNTHYCQKRSQ